MRPTTSADRLSRLLALVPYVVARDTVSVTEAAEAFGVTEKQLREDLNLLWCVELRSPDPYCPIDLSYEGGDITVSEAESISRPLRLGADEAAALLVALRMLAELPGAAEDDAITRVIAKLEAAAGEAAGIAARQVAVQVDQRRGPTLTAIQDALRDGRRLHLTYYVAGRDENTARDVDPMRVLVVEGRSYLEGWCRRADAVRLFRLDQIVKIEILDVAREIPAEAKLRDVDAGLFQASATDIRAVLDLTPSGRWVAEYYPCESAEELGEGRLRVVLRTADPRWVVALALRLGDQGRLVAPGDLAQRVRSEAEAALALYA
ncbi:helix-turn-helix transcriptional regulator [Actinocorallia longicatena]|uniref:WYL domain-containing protein n=1 Tax=Actinocorallia longicatena TaxID=111803 RepID=A0ABP6Q5B8_9ACTN